MALTVEDLYREILNREPDLEGLAFWRSVFGDDVSADERASFEQAAAPELAASAPPIYGIGVSGDLWVLPGVPNAQPQSLEELYRNVLGREASPEEIASWGFGAGVDAGELDRFLGPARNEAVETRPTTGAIGHIAQQILAQNTSGDWSGEGYGSAEKTAYDMAAMLAAQGVTDINQFGVRDKQVTTEEGTYTAKEYYNKATGQPLNSYYDKASGNTWGGTFAGEGSTSYKVRFAENGSPIFYSQYGGSSNEFANLMADLGPVAQIALAVATGGLSIPQQIAAQLAIQVLSGKDIGEAIKGAAISYAVAQIPGLDAVKEGAEYLNGFDPSGVLSGAFQNAATSATKAALTGDDISDALLSGAVAGGTAGAVNLMANSVDGFKDLTPAQQQIAKNAITGAISGKPLDQVLINSAIALANAEIKTAKDNTAAKEAGWADYATQQAAKLTYGADTTPEVYANKQNTTEDEAKQIARDVLGREPTEFEWSQLVGLAEGDAYKSPDLAEIRYNESTFDSNDLAQAYKDVYGKEPTDEWLASDEAIDMLGRSDAQGKNMLQNAYIQDKNTTSNTEAEAIWKAQGNTGPIPEDVLFNMLSTSEDASRAMSETYRITAEDRAATTFDASGFDDPRAAADAAKKAGYNTFSMADGGTFTVLTPAKEGEIKDEIAKKASFGEAFADARQRLGSGKTFEWEGKLYTTDYAPTNKAVPFDGSKAASKEDAAKLAVANGKLSFTYDGKTYGMDMQAASIIANSQNQTAAETNRLLAQAIKPATNESLAETQRLVAAGKPSIMDTVNSMTAQALGTTQRGLGQFVENMGNTYAQMTGDTSYSNAMTKAGKEIQDYAKGNDIYGLDVQKDRVMQAVKLSEESPNFFDKVAIIGAAMAKNPLGAFDIVGSEAVEEIPETIAQIGVALMSGGASLSVTAGKTIIGGISIAGSFIESFGASGKEAYTLSKARGDSDEVALNKSYVNATLGTLAEIPGDLLADKALVGPLMKNFAEKTLTSIGAGLVTNATAGAVSELVSGTLQSYATQMVVDPTTADWSKAVSNGVFEMFIGSAVQTAMATPGAVIDTARVIGRDYSGDDVTLQQVLDGGASIDLGSVSSGTELAVIPGGGTITVGSSISSGEDLGIDYSVALNVLPENLTGAGTVVAYDEDGTPVTLGELLDARAKDGDRGLYTDYLSDIFANPTPVTDQGESAPSDGVTDVVDKTPALPDQSSSMKMAFEAELAKVIDLGYRNEAAITEALARTADNLNILPVMVEGAIGKTQDQLFVDYLDRVGAPVEPEAPVVPPTTPPATGGEVVSVDPDTDTALVIDGSGNVSVVDNTDGSLAPGDNIPATQVTPPTQTQTTTGGETQTGGVDFAEPTDNAVDPTLQDLLSGIGQEGSTTPNLPAVVESQGLGAIGGVVVSVDPVAGTALVVTEDGTSKSLENKNGLLSVGDTVPKSSLTGTTGTSTGTSSGASTGTELTTGTTTGSTTGISTGTEVTTGTEVGTTTGTTTGTGVTTGTSTETGVTTGTGTSTGTGVGTGVTTGISTGTGTDTTTGVGTSTGAGAGTTTGTQATYEQLLQIIKQQQQQEAEAERVRQEELERQRQQQQKVTAAQQGVQSLMGMVPQMYKAAEQTTTPLYSTMDYYDPFGDPFAQTNMRVVSTTVPVNQTKMAQGGYLGDLLAENMSVDDLLNLLR